MVCFVPGCKSGNSSKDKCHLMKMSRNASSETELQWMRNVPKQMGKTFNPKINQICHKHFEDHFIIKTTAIMMGSQIMKEVPRLRWKLTNDAVPTIFSNEKVPKYFDVQARTRRPPRSRDFCQTGRKNKVYSPPRHDPPSPSSGPLNVFEDLSTQVQTINLPPFWISIVTPDKISFFKLLQDDREIIPTFQSERSVFISPQLISTVFVRHTPLENYSATVFRPDEIEILIKQVDSLIICPGISNFNIIKHSDFAYRCGRNWVAKDCRQVIVDQNICENCSLLPHKLSNLAKVSLKPIQGRKQDTLKKYQMKNKLMRRTMRRVRSRVNSLRASSKLLQRQLFNLKENHLEDVINKMEYLSPQTKKTILLSANVAKAKSKHGVRYQADWILQSLLLKICSPKAYRHLRDNNVLPLPNPRYLTSLLRGLPCQFGFNEFVFETLEKDLKPKPRLDRQFVLIFDEMKIREALSYDATAMRFTGYIDYADFSSELKSKTNKRIEADHALVFMCRSLNSKLTQPIASFATRGAAPGHVLAKMIISCISKLESTGCEIVAVISDGATSNKSAWKALGISGDRYLNNKIPNPHDDTRCVHFLCDIPHIVKCIRNHIHKQGFVKFAGKSVNWGFYRALYDIDRQNDIRVAHKLTYQHINPNPFQKMVVSLATQVFSRSVADGLRFYREVINVAFLKGSESTEDFTRKLNDLFDACNARISKEGLRKNSKSYEVIKQFLDSISSEDSFASTVTIASLRVTLRSILDLIDYLCDIVGFSYVLTAKLNQDCLENFFGLLRSFGGDDCHPTATSFSHIFRLLSLYTPTSKTLKGNVKVEEDYSIVSYVESLKVFRKSAALKTLKIKDEINHHIMSKIVDNEQRTLESAMTGDALIQPSSEKCIVFYLCGFLVFKAKAFTSCTACLSGLEDPTLRIQESMLTQIKDLGNLRYPSMSLFNLIVESVEPKIRDVLTNDSMRTSHCVLSSVVSRLNDMNCSGIGCSSNHRYNLVVHLVKYYITVRMYFFAKKQNKDILRSTTETKKKMKEAKLS